MQSTLSSSTRLLAVAAFVAAAAFAQAPLTTGNLVVVRVGDGVAALSNASTATFLDEYTPAGVLVQSIAMPTVASGTQFPLTNSGTATSEGFLTLSDDGNFLLSAGYGDAPGTPSIAGTQSSAVPRVIAVTNMAGIVDTTTALTNAFSAGNIRSAVSTNGVDLWASGSLSSVNYVQIGQGTSTAISAAPANSRVLGTYQGQLYVTSASGAFQGVSQVGTGLPTSTGNVVTLLNGFPTVAGPSAYDFFFADPNTLYVADDRTPPSNGGIQKWTQSGGLWTLQYTLAPTASSGVRGLTGAIVGGSVVLYATTAAPTTSNNLVSVVDNGPGSPFTVVASAGTYQVFRGVRLLSGPPTLSRLHTGCGPVQILAGGSGVLGGSVTTNLAGFTGLTFMGFGLFIQSSPLPFCTQCAQGHEWAASAFGNSNTFNVPTNPAFLGATVGIQGADVLGSNACVLVPVSMTDTIVITIR
jgi:hypothetical protein